MTLTFLVACGFGFKPRFQFVSINDCHSDLLSVESGVTQGSILGPLLFIMFMNDLPCPISNSDALYSLQTIQNVSDT